jgi:hypothetical protein
MRSVFNLTITLPYPKFFLKSAGQDFGLKVHT